MWPRARELPTRLARRTHGQRPPRCRCADLSAAGHCHRHSSARLSLNLGSGGGVGAVSASARLGPVHTHLLRPALAARAPLASASAPELDAFTALLRSSSSSSSVVASTVPDVLQAPARPLRLQITVPTLRRAGINKNPLVKTRPRVAVSVQAASKEAECQLPMDMECGCKTRRLKEQQEQAALEAAAAKQQAAQAQAAQVEAQAQAQAAQAQAQAQAQAAQAAQDAQTQAAVVVTRSSALAVAPLPTPGMLPVLGKTSFHRRHLPQDCIAFSSPEGRKLFTEALNSPTNYMQIYFPLAEQFITQAEPAYCGLATLAMCLNALQIDPGRLWKGPWRWFSEELFDCCTSLAVAKEKGISMSEFICLARCNGVLTDDVRATDDFSLEQFRDIVQRSCATSSEIVVLNYSRKVLGQTGDGHFSPIGGYHAERDMVLLMDVARFKYPPHWVRLSLVYEAMQRLDASIGLPRGLVVLKESAHATGPTLVKQQLFHADEHSTAEIKPAPSPCCNSAAAVEAARRVSALFKN